MVINHVARQFQEKTKLTLGRLAQIVDRYMRQQSYSYEEEVHKPRYTKNAFYKDEQKAGQVRSYDVAFYNHLASSNRPAHHWHPQKKFPSVYYMRCEESAEQLLIGNLQIDDTMPEYWDAPSVGHVLLQPKTCTG